MPDLTRPLALALALGFAMPTAAQEIEGDAGTLGAEDDGLSLGETVQDDGPGTDYVDAEHGDWQIRCFRVPDEPDPCELYQLLEDDEGFPVAEMSVIPLPDGGEAVTGATIVTPLETLLTEQVTLRIDDGSAKRYPFSWCNPVGCVARVGFTASELEAMKRGVEARLTIIPAAAPNETVEITASLMGFTAGYEAVQESPTRSPE